MARPSRKIKDFSIQGSYDDDAKILDIQDKFHTLLEEQMRSQGSVPVLNISTKWFTSWDSEREAYDFELVMYGVFVGKKKQDEIIGYKSDIDKMLTEDNLGEE